MAGEQTSLPAAMPGHWDTPEGREMATEYLGMRREELTKGDMSDLLLANAQFLASRADLDLIVYQTAAKERIRWLSAQLAAASLALAGTMDALLAYDGHATDPADPSGWSEPDSHAAYMSARAALAKARGEA